MRLRRISSWMVGAAVLLAFGLALRVASGTMFRSAVGDVLPLLILAATTFFAASNAIGSRGHARLFWWLLTTGCVLWGFNQAAWTWLEVVLRKPLPDPFIGDIVLFLHVVPIMAAVAIRPPVAGGDAGILPSMFNVLTLLLWWVVVYAFVVFPDEYVVLNVGRYTRTWDLLYLAEGVILVALSSWAFRHSCGAWRRVYRNIFLGSFVYLVASTAINNAIRGKTYATGGVDDVVLAAGLLFFLAAAYEGHRNLPEIQVMPAFHTATQSLTPHLAKLALLSLPLMGYWALFMSKGNLRGVRFAVAMGGVAALAFLVFLKQHLLDRRLVQLLKQSRQSYRNLQRLQGRVIQQEKLASLGELVALAASELDYPLSAVLECSDRLAASSSLRTDQLATAQKIGQQARRTRELVSDLMSFAQQTPGEKSPLELKPLVQRAVQMETFKLENRRITLSVQSEDHLPRVLGNSNQLLQAFVQIVENAVDALQEAGGGRLIVSLRREKGEIVLEFADTGTGLKNPERVFDPFYTTKPVGKGTGLGLSATYGVIQDHKGQITCHNRPEGGAVFEIRLPILTASAALA